MLAAVFALGLSACASTGVEQYRAETPALDLKTYLNGTLDAWGMFQGRSGEVQKRFHVVIDAKWTGDTGVLDENFKWSDGTTSRRVWTLKKQADGTWRGTADDVVGEAARRVSDVTRAASPEIPWRSITGMRNRLVHDYFDVDLPLVWQSDN